MKLKSVFSTWIAGTAVGIAADGLGKHFDWLSGWHSQYGQDQKIMKWLYSERVSDEQFYDLTGDEPRKGVFIELGAGDGLDKSNSLAFEEKLGWTGLLIEASPSLYSQLQQNRPNATCVRACAAGSAIEKVFAEDGLSGGTIAIQLQNENSTWISVTCQSLSSLIDMHLGDRGSHIDYLSLDVEGSELEILRSFNFHKHKVDVISIEVPDFLPEIMYKRLSKLLIRNGYRFLERIVIDEIWVRRRGLHPDPSCMLPLVELQTFPPITPSGGWGGLRSTLGSLLEILQSLMRGSFFNMKEGDPRVKRFSASVQGFFALWSDGDIREWEEQCPIGMLSLGLAFSLLRDRDNSPQDTGHNVMLELRQQTIFYYTKQLVAMFQTVRHSDLVKEFETAQEEFFFRMPLGNLWHLSSFEEILESGWPFFGTAGFDKQGSSHGSPDCGLSWYQWSCGRSSTSFNAKDSMSVEGHTWDIFGSEAPQDLPRKAKIDQELASSCGCLQFAWYCCKHLSSSASWTSEHSREVRFRNVWSPCESDGFMFSRASHRTESLSAEESWRMCSPWRW